MKLGDLPFVANRDGKTLPKYDMSKGESGRCFWHVPDHEDSALGRRHALEFLKYLEAEPSGLPVLPNVIADMPRDLGQAEISFLTLIQYAAANGANAARRVNAYWEGCELKENAK